MYPLHSEPPEVSFRHASAYEAGLCAALCAQAIGDELKVLYGGLVSGLSVADIVYRLCSAEDTELSWRRFVLVELDGAVVAGLCLVPTEERPLLVQNLTRCLQEDCGLGLWGLIRLFFRSLLHAPITWRTPLPPSSLYIPVGAVHPEHQRNGVAAQTLRYVMDCARGNGFRNVCLHVRRSNDPAMALYRSLGFQASSGRWAKRPLMVLSLLPADEVLGSV